MSLSKLSLGGNNNIIYKLFPPREILVIDIAAGDGNIEKNFKGVVWYAQEKYILRDRRRGTIACPACWAMETNNL
jgi:hypothetical protein